MTLRKIGVVAAAFAFVAILSVSSSGLRKRLSDSNANGVNEKRRLYAYDKSGDDYYHDDESSHDGVDYGVHHGDNNDDAFSQGSHGHSDHGSYHQEQEDDAFGGNHRI